MVGRTNRQMTNEEIKDANVSKSTTSSWSLVHARVPFPLEKSVQGPDSRLRSVLPFLVLTGAQGREHVSPEKVPVMSGQPDQQDGGPERVNLGRNS